MGKKSVLISYFSGTGNTERVAFEYKKAFECQGLCVIAVDIKDGRRLRFEGVSYDILGILYPVHAFNAPLNLMRYASLLKERFKDAEKKVKTFITSVSGEPLTLNDAASCALIKRLGPSFEVKNEYRYLMPYNIIFHHTDEEARRMWRLVVENVPLDVKEILEGKQRRLDAPLFARILRPLFKIEHFGARFNGRLYRVSNDCVKCMKCIEACPTFNISLSKDGKFCFGGECLMCMRCSFSCPVDAIRIGLFNSWRVNGAYDFKGVGVTPIVERPYLRKAYERYYERMERRGVASINEKSTT